MEPGRRDLGLALSMESRVPLSHWFRLCVVGSCFVLVGAGGVLMSAFVFPLVGATSRDATQKAARVKWIIHKLFGILTWVLQACGVMRLEAKNAGMLRRCGRMLVVANHPSYIDVVVLLSLMPDAGCVVKSALWLNPFFGGVVRAAEYVRNSSADTLVDDCAAVLAAGTPLIVFPEGTRSNPGAPLKFLRGAAYIALKTGVPIRPVVIRCDPPFLTKRQKWYQLPTGTFRFAVEPQSLLDPRDFVSVQDPPRIAARRLTSALENYFSEKLGTYGRA